MPFQSEKQRKYLWANEPKIAKKWTKEYGSKPRPHNAKGGKVIKPRGFNMMLPGKKQYTTVY